jgi:hypothetical protein
MFIHTSYSSLLSPIRKTFTAIREPIRFGKSLQIVASLIHESEQAKQNYQFT